MGDEIIRFVETNLGTGSTVLLTLLLAAYSALKAAADCVNFVIWLNRPGVQQRVDKAVTEALRAHPLLQPPPTPPATPSEQVQELLYAIEHSPAACTLAPDDDKAIYLSLPQLAVDLSGFVWSGPSRVPFPMTDRERVLVRQAAYVRYSALENEATHSAIARLSSARASLQSRPPANDLGEGDE